MTHDQEQLIAYIATLFALSVIFIAALLVSCIRPELVGKVGTLGLGTVIGGLLGALRFPSKPGATQSDGADK